MSLAAAFIWCPLHFPVLIKEAALGATTVLITVTWSETETQINVRSG
jgi:hypothetical protein